MNRIVGYHFNATIDEINQKRQELNKIAQEYKADIMALQEKNK